MKTIINRIIMALIPAILFIGCSDIDSEDVKTSGMYAGIQIYTEDTSSARVVVNLNAGGPTGSEIDLSNGDTLTATVGSSTQTLGKSEVPFLNEISYNTTFYTNAESQTFTVSFTREDDTNAPSSTVTMPSAFSISSPTEGSDYASGDTISISWDANASASDSMTLDIDMDCSYSDASGDHYTSHSYSIAVTDNGSYSLSRDTAVDGFVFQGTCVEELSLTRKRSGSLDPNYGEGGYIYAKQNRSVTFDLE